LLHFTSILQVKAVDYLTLSFQKLMKYRNSDGSFSSFSKNQNNGSVWLTANALRYLRKAQRYLHISEEIFIEALAFIQSRQTASGSFKIDDVDIHEIAVTSFVGILLDEFTASYPQYLSTVIKAREFIEKSSGHDADVYTLAISTFFMFQVESKVKFQMFEKLAGLSQRQNGHVHWKNSNKSSFVTTTMDLKASAYGLLILDHIPELFADAFKVLQWLLTQQSLEHRVQASYEGIIAFEAISKFAARLVDIDERLDVVLGDLDDDVHEVVRLERSSKLVANRFHVS
jgi:hypothetical protein